MYKFTVSVRAYWTCMKRGYNFHTAEGCIAAADDLGDHPCEYGGMRVRTELYRAGGLGVLQIYRKLNERKSIEEIRSWCNHCDLVLHESLD